MNSTEAPRFRIAVHRARGGYYARAVDIPGCISRGDSEVEAVENARSAIRAYLLLARLIAADRPTVHVEISP